MLIKIGKEILGSKGAHQNGIFLYFGAFKCLDGTYWTVCCSLDPVLVI